jgi:hypothetical protein
MALEQLESLSVYESGVAQQITTDMLSQQKSRTAATLRRTTDNHLHVSNRQKHSHEPSNHDHSMSGLL